MKIFRIGIDKSAFLGIIRVSNLIWWGMNMKKFLIFLVSIVVIVCMGTTTYYFLRNDETINFKTKEIYCNAGDIITLRDLGYKHVKPHKDTKFNYNAGGEEVKNLISYDEDKGYYIVGENGGNVTLLITTSNKKFAEFKVNVHIGNGSSANPYYIDDEASLSKIGQSYGLDKHYMLRNDIAVSSSFKAIGYNYQAEKWVGFSGNFNGNGYSISGFRLSPTDTEDVGLFSVINKEAVVTDLTIKNARIDGDFDTAGILAGKVLGEISKIRVEGGEVSSTKNNAQVGSIAGYIGNINLVTSYAKQVALSAGGEGSVVGGLAGTLDETFVQACYASNIDIIAGNTSKVGGFAGKFIVGTETGSIQQSYANATSTNANFAGFVGEINKNDSFDVKNASVLRYLIGNIAVSNGTVVKTVNLPNKEDNSAFFTSFEDETNGYYLISNFKTENDFILATDLVFYALDPVTKIEWDANVWLNANNMLPELRMGLIAPSTADGAYIRRNLNKVYISNINSLSTITNTANKEFVLQNNLTLPSDWQPLNISNCTIDGNGKTITYADGTATAIFNVVTNSTIKNLTIANANTSAQSKGALANDIVSTDEAFASTIENVHVTYAGESLGNGEFGGLVGYSYNTNINNCSVRGLNYVGDANLVGGLVAELNKSTLTNSSVNATIKGNYMVGGAVAQNINSTINNVSANVIVKTNAQNGQAYLGGLVSENTGAINNSNAYINVYIENQNNSVVAGGVTALNKGSINSVYLFGEGINVLANASAVYTNQFGGVAGVNEGEIKNVNVFVNHIGTYTEGKNDIVGGVSAINSTASSKVSKVVVSADIYGNEVAGVVAYMNASAEASIDQVLVGKLNRDTNEVTENIIKGDKYVAGICYDMRAGAISNIQAKSRLVGGVHTTRSSLAVLIFVDGTKLTNSTIDSSFEGNGTFYLDTWNDFCQTAQAENFGFLQNDGRFNVYANDAYSGSFQSVVINTEKATSNGVGGIRNSYFETGNAFLIYQTVYYENSEESSFYKVANNADFANSAIYKTNWEITPENAGFFGFWGWDLGAPTFTRGMTFDIGGVWAEGTGINLAFIANV